MELKIHKSLFKGKTLAQLESNKLSSIEGGKLSGTCKYNKKVWQINYVGPSGIPTSPMDYTKDPS